MGGFRRRLRRQAREAAKQLVSQGVPPREFGRVVEDARVGRVLLRVIEEMEKRLDGGEGKVSVREGLAAIKEIRQMKAAQQKALEESAEFEEAQALQEELAARRDAISRWAGTMAEELGERLKEPANKLNSGAAAQAHTTPRAATAQGEICAAS